jgi:hypothetical protein
MDLSDLGSPTNEIPEPLYEFFKKWVEWLVPVVGGVEVLGVPWLGVGGLGVEKATVF